MNTANKWIDDRIRERDDFNTAKLAEMEEIAAALPGDWVVIRPEDESPNRLYSEPMEIQRLDKLRSLWVMVLWNSKDRFKISATDWPTYTDREDRLQHIRPGALWNPQENQPECTAARRRGGAAIAKDIERKILPEYERLYERCRTVASEWQISADKFKSKCEEVAQACGYEGTINIYSSGSKHFRLDDIPGEQYGVQITYETPETVKINMGAELAIKVINFIKSEAAA